MRSGRGRRKVLQSSSVDSTSLETVVNDERLTRSRIARSCILTDSTNVSGPNETETNRSSYQPYNSGQMKRRRVSYSEQGKTSGDDESRNRSFSSSVKRKEPTAGPSTANDDVEVKEIVQQLGKIRTVLGMAYVDVADRLKLDTVPYCVQDRWYCKNHHHRKCPRPRFIERVQSDIVGTFSKQNRRLHYLKSVQLMCMRMEFPGEDVLAKILEMILISKETDDDHYSSDYILQYCVIVAETIVMKFPPCWPDINGAYQKVLMGNVDVKKYFPKAIDTEPAQFLVFVLNILSETISSKDVVRKLQSDDSDSDNEPFAYNNWLQKNTAEESFTQHSRDEKLDRIFLVLHIIMKILEHDFSIWMLRYPSKPDKAMYSDSAPLIARIFFDKTYWQITSPVKNFLEIFVICVCIPFPQEKVKILSRLISLLSVAINLYQKQHVDEIRYPFIDTKAQSFAKEIFKTIDNKFGRDVSQFLTVIKAIKIPFIKYLVIDQLLYKMNPDPGNMSVKKIYENFNKKRWEECEEGTRSLDDYAHCNSTSDRYPMSPSKFQKRPKQTVIYRVEYLDILLDALRSYCDTYRILSIIKYVFANQTFETSQTSEPRPSSETPLNLKRMEADIGNLEKKLNRKRSIIRHKVEDLPYSHILVDSETMNMYRENVKYMGLLLKLLKTKRNPIFNNITNFLDSVLNVD